MSGRRRGRSRGAAALSSRKSVSQRQRTDQPERPKTRQDVYNEMIDGISEPAGAESNFQRPFKRRKTIKDHDSSPVPQNSSPIKSPTPKARPQQVIYDGSDDTNDSDLNWEEVDIADEGEDGQQHDQSGLMDISVNLDAPIERPETTQRTQRAPPSAAEKKKRLDLHKVHLCCLIAHVHVRNSWCNNEQVQGQVRKVLDKRTISSFHPASTLSQVQRSRSFIDALQRSADKWRSLFKVTARGLRKAEWVDDPELHHLKLPEDLDISVNLEGFSRLVDNRKGSRDVGAQAFCAMLRSAGVDARLVCSLQPLPLAHSPKAKSPQPTKRTIIYEAPDVTEGSEDEDVHDQPHNSPSRMEIDSPRPTPPPRIRRVGQQSTEPTITRDAGKAPAKKKRTKIVESSYPVYWVEAFNEAIQKWIPVDPIVTNTLGKVTKFEPPANDQENSMCYVLAFEEDGFVRDVTRRYAKAYNGKTYKARIESTKDGSKWWKRAIKLFRRKRKSDRDQLEDFELSNKEAAEPMPRNVQDFKNHPYYVLERHLRHNEIITPRREAGKVSVGKAADNVEPIFRRQDVKVVQSADKWYRTGREVKPGEQPFKYSKARRRRMRSLSADDMQEEAEDERVGLYAEFQTDPYVPPPIVRGQVPRNAYGNLDVYVSSMIPSGGVHIRCPEAAKAARILRVDFADAVTGFDFKGRQGTAVVNGIIAAKDFCESIVETIKGLRWEVKREELRYREKQALKLWKRFMIALRVRERVMEHASDDDEDNDEDEDEEYRQELASGEDEDENFEEMQGGFFLEKDQTELAALTAGPSLVPHEDEVTATAPLHPQNSANVEDDIDEFVHCTFSPWDTHRSGKPQRQTERASTGRAGLGDGKAQSRHIGTDKTYDIAGGFLREDLSDPQPKVHQAGSGGLPGVAESETETNAGGGFLVEDDDDLFEETSTEKMHHASNQPGDSTNPHPGDAMANHEQESGPLSEPLHQGDTSTNGAALDNTSPAKRSDESSTQHDNASDEHHQHVEEHYNTEDDDSEGKGSLLSHDPEDDDAEPEWLNEDATLAG